MDRGQQEPAAGHAELRHHAAAPVDERPEQPGRVGHDVAGQLDAVPHPFGGQVLTRHLGRAEQQPGQVVDDHPVDLLGHRAVEGSQPRLDVHHGNGQLRGRERRQGRVGVAVDDGGGRLLGLEDRLDPLQDPCRHGRVRPGAHAEAMAGGGDPELLVEEGVELVVVVLVGVDGDEVERPAQGGVQRGGLDQLWPVAHHGDDLRPRHGPDSTARLARDLACRPLDVRETRTPRPAHARRARPT
jgi:hypothetical protein